MQVEVIEVMKAVKVFREALMRVIATNRIKLALSTNVPAETDAGIREGVDILMFHGETE